MVYHNCKSVAAREADNRAEWKSENADRSGGSGVDIEAFERVMDKNSDESDARYSELDYELNVTKEDLRSVLKA